MSETTRILGLPVPKRTDWKKIFKYCGFSAVIIGMLSFGIYYLINSRPENEMRGLIETNENFPAVDIPGSEADPTVDDAPGVVTLSDKDFALRVEKAANL